MTQKAILRRRKRLRIGTIVGLAVLLCGPGAPPGQAFWDDVHYFLTYFMARCAGFTPTQAYRLAAADLVIDYDSLTEAEQVPKNKLDLIPIFQGKSDFTEAQLDPRWKFHAFRDVRKFPDALGDDPTGAAADKALDKQEEDLFRLAKLSKNPGALLHFIQDRLSHAKFGTRWAHFFNPLKPEESTAKVRQADRPVGSTTDWLSAYDFNTLTEMVYKSEAALKDFMRQVLPQQKVGTKSPFDYQDTVVELQEANKPCPVGLTADEMPLYAVYIFTGDDTNVPPKQWQSSFSINYKLLTQDLFTDPVLTAGQKAKFRKHNAGPKYGPAEQVILAAMTAAGFIETRPRQSARAPLPDYVKARRKYPLNQFGTAVKEFVDDWTLAGRLEVAVSGIRNDPNTYVDVVLKMPPTMDGENEYALGPSQPIALGATGVWDSVPVGEVIIEASKGGQRLVRLEGVEISKLRNSAQLRVVETGVDDAMMDEGWYVFQYETVYPKALPSGKMAKEKKTWYAPKRARSRMKKDDLLTRAKEAMASETTGAGLISSSVKIFSGPHASLPRDIPSAKVELFQRP